MGGQIELPSRDTRTLEVKDRAQGSGDDDVEADGEESDDDGTGVGGYVGKRQCVTDLLYLLTDIMK